jgi:hypothetical protein
MSNEKTVVAVQSVLSTEDVVSFSDVGVSVAKSELNRKQAIDTLYHLLYISQGMVLNHARWEEGRLAFCKGYADSIGVPMYENGAKLTVAVKQAWYRITVELKALYQIEKPADTTNSDSVKKAETRSKQAEEKETQMKKSDEVLTAEVQALRLKGDKESMKKAVKVLDIIDAKKKAEEKAVEKMFTDKHKLIKDLLGNCKNHKDLDSIIKTLQKHLPPTSTI